MNHSHEWIHSMMRGAYRGRGGPFWRESRWSEIFGEQGSRAERGEVRYLVLHAIEDAPRHGYEIIQFIEERSRGVYRPSPGGIYPTLQMLEEMGFARGAEKDGRKVYQITEEGRRELAAHREAVDEFYERQVDSSWEARGEVVEELVKRVSRITKAVRRAARRGTLSPTVLPKVWDALDEALKKIEALLGQEP